MGFARTQKPNLFAGTYVFVQVVTTVFARTDHAASTAIADERTFAFSVSLTNERRLALACSFSFCHANTVSDGKRDGYDNRRYALLRVLRRGFPLAYATLRVGFLDFCHS